MHNNTSNKRKKKSWLIYNSSHVSNVQKGGTKNSAESNILGMHIIYCVTTSRRGLESCMKCRQQLSFLNLSKLPVQGITCQWSTYLYEAERVSWLCSHRGKMNPEYRELEEPVDIVPTESWNWHETDPLMQTLQDGRENTLACKTMD